MTPNNSNFGYEFMQMAEQFFGGYMLIPERFPIDYAKYFLFCHSLELALKSYLIHLGDDVDNVRKLFGHDIEKLLVDCKKRGLSISDARVKRLSNLSEVHLRYWARYPKQDWSKGGIPTVAPFEADALSVLDAVSTSVNGAPMFRSWT
jgi:hypothetical protein